MEVGISGAAKTLNCPVIAEPSTGLPLTCNSSSVDDFKELTKLTCRLCACEEHGREFLKDDASTKSSTNGWIVLSKRWFQATETVECVLKKYLPEGLMANLPIEFSLSCICPSCFSSIQDFKEFCDHILKGQEKLAKTFQSINPNLATTGESSVIQLQPRKRGRPKKGTTSKKVVDEVSCKSNTIERGKRSIRPPTRYETLHYANNDSLIKKETKNDDESKSVESGNETNDCSQKNQNEVALSEDVLITDFSAQNTTELQLNIFSNMDEEGSSKSDELQDISKLNLKIEPDDNTIENEDETGRSAQNDPTFNLEENHVVKRKKRGRPKKRKRKDFKCELCDRVYTAYPSLVYHKLSHHENKREFQCTECGKEFAHKALLANHMFTHSSAKSFICEETNCNCSFKTRASLHNHIRNVHDLKREAFTCETCGLRLSTKGSLQAHHKIHTGSKPYVCNYCDKGFHHKGNFKEHVRTHTREKPYKCEISECGRSFTTSSQLRSHKMRHLAKKAFLCSECGMSFNQNTSLIIHLRSHKGELLECSSCQKQFKDVNSLKTHLRVHSGEAPFQCDVCNKVFKDPSNFSKHKKIHTKLQNTGSTEKNASTLVKNHRNSVSIPSYSTESVANDISCRSVETNASENDMVIADTSENFADGAGQMNESLVQILSEDELAALGGGTSADDGNIVFLYQPEDLFSISVDENPPLVDVPTSMDDGETVVLQEVIGIGDLNALKFEPQ